jgi:hypothetical protein
MASNARFRAVVWIVVVLGVGFAALQCVRPSLPNPPVTAELQAPPEVKEILRNSCYSCHSNETRLPIYDQVVPAYWLVQHDVKEARQHLNFSEIGKLPPAQQKAMLWEAVNMIQLGAMPLPRYLTVHPGAKVTPQQVEVLRAYLNPPTPTQPAKQEDISAANAQYKQWIAMSETSILNRQVKPTLNGIDFLPDYKNWKAISSTERYDNHTMREILGNDIAVKAIAEGHINPWPDGTTFAKVAWTQQPDAQGKVHTGSFIQVEFMIRDSKKYEATKGWGWARWRGMDLKPYGKDAAFSNECISCHEPVRKNDYVYTMPLRGAE